MKNIGNFTNTVEIITQSIKLDKKDLGNYSSTFLVTQIPSSRAS